MQSMLVMERRPKDYMPFEYDKLPQYNGEDLTSLEGIDEFTCKFTSEEDLKAEIVMTNCIDDFESSNKMKIVYYENEK